MSHTKITRESIKHTTISVRVNAAINETINAIAKRFGISKSTLIVRAAVDLVLLYEQLFKQNELLSKQVDRLSDENARLRGEQPMTLATLGAYYKKNRRITTSRLTLSELAMQYPGNYKPGGGKCRTASSYIENISSQKPGN